MFYQSKKIFHMIKLENSSKIHKSLMTMNSNGKKTLINKL